MATLQGQETRDLSGRELLEGERRSRPVSSRLLQRLDAASASMLAAPLAAAFSLVFLLGSAIARRTEPWLTIFQGLAAAVTLVMVFALQHTQSRQQTALQRKLDEILRVLPDTDPRVMHLESAPEEQLEAVNDTHARLRGDGLNNGTRGR